MIRVNLAALRGISRIPLVLLDKEETAQLEAALPALVEAVEAALAIEAGEVHRGDCDAYWSDPPLPCTCGAMVPIGRFDDALQPFREEGS